MNRLSYVLRSQSPKLWVVFFSFIVVFFSMYPIYATCNLDRCLEGSLAIAVLFSYTKINEIDFFLGKDFYGIYFYGPKIKSLLRDSSKRNILTRRVNFFTLIMADVLVIVFIVKYSWIFN